jgi:hypothetical protein
LLYRLNAHARKHWSQIQDLDVRYRGQFAYVQVELADGTTQPLIRLPYGGSTHTAIILVVVCRRELVRAVERTDLLRGLWLVIAA